VLRIKNISSSQKHQKEEVLLEFCAAVLPALLSSQTVFLSLLSHGTYCFYSQWAGRQSPLLSLDPGHAGSSDSHPQEPLGSSSGFVLVTLSHCRRLMPDVRPCEPLFCYAFPSHQCPRLHHACHLANAHFLLRCPLVGCSLALGNCQALLFHKPLLPCLSLPSAAIQSCCTQAVW